MYIDFDYKEVAELEARVYTAISRWFENNYNNLAPTEEEITALVGRMAEAAVEDFTKDMLKSSTKVFNMLIGAYCSGFCECKWITLGEKYLPGYGGEWVEEERAMQEAENKRPVIEANPEFDKFKNKAPWGLQNV
jgi:hypothetical protein